jgi:hypothetical protein
VFTFGREHETKCAIQHIRKPEDAERITGVIDAVHDLLEGKAAAHSIRPIIVRAFSDGGDGVWQQSGSWLCKLSATYPELATVWSDLSNDPKAGVRFRVACFINDLPRPLALEIGGRLKDDRAKRTREMALARLAEIGA